jgi:hypothetical protein
MGTIFGSSMSSSARAVFFGSLPGIGLLTKCTTCAASDGRPPVVGGGFAVCRRPKKPSARCATRCAL